MTDLNKGERWYDPAAEQEFVVQEDVRTRGMSVAEMDQMYVRIKFEDGQEVTVPHERFRGRTVYERVATA